jgi:hypothetical protein
MPLIDLNDFIQNVQFYQSSEYALETLYQQILKRHDILDRLENIDDNKTRIVLEFLNQWKCRLSYSCTSNLAKTLRESSELFSKFDSHRLEEVSLKSLIITSDDIQEVFRRIASVQAGRRTVGATATSKILHLINPNFFMMSDVNIRHGYGCYDNELGYVNFMWRMKIFCDIIRKKYSTTRNIPIDSAFQYLVAECKSVAPSWPKLLDEHNWVKYNP